jgi:hypothetical protein
MVGVISREAAVQANSIALLLRAMLTQRRRPLKLGGLALSLYQEMRELFQGLAARAEAIARLSHRLLLITNLLFSHIY